MRRMAMRPRANLDARIKEFGFDFHAPDGQVYWDETAAYAFTLAEIERDIEAPTAELGALCLELVNRVVGDEEALKLLRVPPHAWEAIAESWRRRDPTLYGRFDFSYDGKGPARLLEYNADTPTSLYEAAVFQWVWLEDQIASGALPEQADQFNSLHEKLIARLAKLGRGRRLDLAAMPGNVEDDGFIAYLDDCARQAGLETQRLAMADIGVTAEPRFVDAANRPVELMFKLYPWEWMWSDPYGRSPAVSATQFLEPPWKAILSNKGMLALLWRMAPGHPNLLPAFFEHDPAKAELGAHFARKPLYSREGANVMLVDGDRVLAREEGDYGAEGHIRQALALLPDFDGMRPVVGSWLIGDEACGLGVREDTTAITRNSSRFLPHAILD
jgi:glutathionylspermidine synthase